MRRTMLAIGTVSVLLGAGTAVYVGHAPSTVAKGATIPNFATVPEATTADF